jgi:hypothetical protein
MQTDENDLGYLMHRPIGSDTDTQLGIHLSTFLSQLTAYIVSQDSMMTMILSNRGLFREQKAKSNYFILQVLQP